MQTIFLVGVWGVMLGLGIIVVAAFRESDARWFYLGRWVTFFSVLTIFWGVVKCVMESNSIFGF